MVFCRGCANEIHETAPTCPRCGAPQAIAAARGKTSSAAAAQTISPAWQKKFALLEKAGGPKLSKLSQLKFGERIGVAFNIWGFLLAPVYYLVKGMWKKAIVLTALGIALVLILEVILEAFKIRSSAASFATCAIFATRANIDYYKKMVLGDNGWW
jgi:hypothetical protein